jgi:hypothetical protein
VLVHHPGARNAIAAGTIPILTRLTIESLDQPIRIDRAIESFAGFELAHDREGDAVSRIFMNTWCEVRGIAGRIGPRQTDRELAVAGRLFAEHTFTRLFAPANQRRVTRLEVEGYPAIPEVRHLAQAGPTAQDAPEGARWLDELAPDVADTAFTLDHTDANQHVNSLVYIRVFLDALQRRLASGGHPLNVRSRAVDIAFRKPCFIGDRVRTHLRLFDRAGSLGAAGFIAGTGDEPGKPRCYLRILLGA